MASTENDLPEPDSKTIKARLRERMSREQNSGFLITQEEQEKLVLALSEGSGERGFTKEQVNVLFTRYVQVQFEFWAFEEALVGNMVPSFKTIDIVDGEEIRWASTPKGTIEAKKSQGEVTPTTTEIQ